MLKVGSAEEIRQMFQRMESDRRAMIEGLIQLVYFMRGAIQYETIKNMTYVERQSVATFIEKRLESEAKKMYPIY